MPAFVNSDGLAAFGVTVADADVAQKLCDVASAMVRAEYPDIDDRIAGERPAAVVVEWVVAAMVKRALAVCDETQTSAATAVGPFSQQTSWSGERGLYFKRSERRWLSGRAAPAGAFTINTIDPDAPRRLPYWDLDYPAQVAP